MGSVATDDTPHPPVTVLVTGFGPFKKDYPVNPSWEIARSLPDWLPPLRAKTVTTNPGPDPTTSAPAPKPIPPVRILVHPEPIRVSYTVVRDLAPRLWDGTSHPPPQAPSKLASSSLSSTSHPGHDHPLNVNQTGDGNGNNSSNPASPPPPSSSPSSSSSSSSPSRNIDFAIHIGMAGPRHFYSVERRGHRDDYALPDVDGEHLCDSERRAREGPDWVWEGVPAELLTAFDLDDVARRWRGFCPKHMDLRISEDAGHYLCDFIYFSSLAHLYKAGRKRKVLFLHVPSDASEQSVALGRELLLQLIRSVVESEIARHGSFQGGNEEEVH
ncbi:hypothetical protein VTK26DRAFT_3268 [Humicola hyalothermophila]